MRAPRVRLALATTLVATVAGTALVPATGSLAASESPTATATATATTAKPVVAGSRYLALGDSVVFGYRESTNLPTPDYSDPTDFRGYPEELAATLGLRLTNAGCPGETTASFIDKTAQSNGCENHWSTATASGAPGGYRTMYPLHTTYAGSQLRFAKRFLTDHPHTRLVTLTLGANDGFLCQTQTSDGCVSEVNTLLDTVRTNLTAIFKALRMKAGYTGQLVVVDYYALDYSDSFQTASVKLIDDAIATAAAPYNVKVASGFDAFERASAQASGNVCTAQLVTALTGGGCGVHPSVAGAVVLAQAVARRVKK